MPTEVTLTREEQKFVYILLQRFADKALTKNEEGDLARLAMCEKLDCTPKQLVALISSLTTKVK